MSIPVILPALQKEFHFKNTMAGFIRTALVLSYAGTQIPSGYLGDKIEKRKIIVAGLFFSAIFMLLAGFTEKLIAFILSIGLIGAGLGAYYAPAISLISGWYQKEKRGKSIGFHETASSFGSVAGPVLASFFLAVIGWRTGFIWLSLLILVILPFIWIYGTEPPKKNHKKFDLDFKKLIPLIVIFSLTAMAWMGFTNFLTKYLTYQGIKESQAGILFSIMPATAMISMPLAGHLSDKIGRKKIIMMLILFSSPLTFLITLTDSILFYIIILFLIGASLFAAYPVIITYISDHIPQDMKSSAFGVVNALSMGLAALTPPVLGYLIDNYSYQLAFSTISILIVLSAISTKLID
ncbi:MAG: MFS family permease [Candidatus Methanohalarchaeum thermophilum]|uniref:MFS family permease n=1 Tax=Methanohalarchaeum thermophilum TaxID=1903181 RepID=A0A1Q6DTI4_METT1|nr:MAG: MFS family permease [Candidatus Methanohalarchaeum thermophilum]